MADCPKSNAKLGHGRAVLRRLSTRVSPWDWEAIQWPEINPRHSRRRRFATLLSRAAGARISTEDALKVATFGGELKEGAQADLIVVSLAGVHQVPSYDPVATLIFASSGRDVIYLVVEAAQVFCGERRVVGVDEERLQARML